MTVIQVKEQDPAVVVCKYADPTEGYREGLTLGEAREVAAEDPGLLFILRPAPGGVKVKHYTKTKKPDYGPTNYELAIFEDDQQQQKEDYDTTEAYTQLPNINAILGA